MTERSDLVAEYLDVLGIEPGPPSRELADELVRRHVATFPFGSVGVQLGDDLPLGLAAVHDRLVVRRRGGYCFEQNLLMHEVLAELGFAPTMYLARVLLSGSEHPPLTHRVTVVEIDGDRYLVDVGFGPQGPTAAVPFDGEAVGEPWRRFRLGQTGPSTWTTYGGGADELAPMYRFELAPYGESDCELGHFYAHRHPDAHFVQVLVASTLLDGETRSLRDRDYWVIRADGVESRRIDDPDELAAILLNDFGLRVDHAECVRLLDGRTRRD